MSVQLPTTVVTFGGGSSPYIYHRLAGSEDDPEPACRQGGKNPLLKDRKLIESHYRPCERCFPNSEALEAETDVA